MKPNASPLTSSTMRGHSEQAGQHPSGKRYGTQRRMFDGKYLGIDKSIGVYRPSDFSQKGAPCDSPSRFSAISSDKSSGFFRATVVGSCIPMSDLSDNSKTIERIIGSSEDCIKVFRTALRLTAVETGIKFAERVKELVVNQHRSAHVTNLPPYKQHIVRHYKPDSPDFTAADKEWIDKIDGHALTIDDLY